ncbi:MAG: PucR family transcriptional regulator [Thermoleophilaceae bacterium]
MARYMPARIARSSQPTKLFQSRTTAARKPRKGRTTAIRLVAFWIRELSADSAEGHAQEQSAIAGEAERRRRRLLALLVQSPPADPAVVRSAADEAAWPLPRTLAVIALDARNPRRVAARLGTGAIAARVQELDCAVMADPDAPGRRAEVERAAAGSEGALAAVGPTVTWQDAAESFTRARDALALVREGALEVGDGERRARAGGGALVVAQEHVTELLLARERRLLSDLASDLLAPLASLTPAARRRLSDTLLSWLRHQGRLDPVAADLGIHPQTVRYRLGRARELLGTAVDDPDRRLELELALRARRLEARVVEEARPQPVG